MSDAGEYSLSETKVFTCSIDEVTTTKKKKNKRRFADEQIRSLEMMFENETRLEPRKKLQLAEELGLQPRQVAIWFQNKRARWKSKQLEKDYSILQGNYNSLASCFESLKNEKQALQIQVQKMKDMLQEPKEENQHSGECVAVMNIIDTESENGEIERSESEEQPGASMERSKHVLRVLSDDNLATKAEYFGQEDKPLLINMDERPDDSCLTSTHDWGNFDTGDLFSLSSSSNQWWDFWS